MNCLKKNGHLDGSHFTIWVCIILALSVVPIILLFRSIGDVIRKGPNHFADPWKEALDCFKDIYPRRKDRCRN